MCLHRSGGLNLGSNYLQEYVLVIRNIVALGSLCTGDSDSITLCSFKNNNHISIFQGRFKFWRLFYLSSNHLKVNLTLLPISTYLGSHKKYEWLCPHPKGEPRGCPRGRARSSESLAQKQSEIVGFKETMLGFHYQCVSIEFAIEVEGDETMSSQTVNP